jgi:hypothetical protein
MRTAPLTTVILGLVPRIQPSTAPPVLAFPRPLNGALVPRDKPEDDGLI